MTADILNYTFCWDYTYYVATSSSMECYYLHIYIYIYMYSSIFISANIAIK